MPYGAVAAYALMEAGVLSPGTSKAREGLANGVAAQAETTDQALRRQTEALLAVLRTDIEDLCEAYGVPLDDARRAHLLTLDSTALEALRVHLERDRAWPA